LLRTASATAAAALPLPELYRRVERHIPPFEWPILADDIAAILKLKEERHAVRIRFPPAVSLVRT
jgi:quinolinate synthase